MIDITKEAMEVGPTTHYMMGGVRVHPETQMSTVPGLFAAGESAAGLHGANRLGGNSLSDLLVFGQRAGEHAARFARDCAPAKCDPAEVREAERKALAPFDGAKGSGEGPFALQHELQAAMLVVPSEVFYQPKFTYIWTLAHELRHCRAGPLAWSGFGSSDPDSLIYNPAHGALDQEAERDAWTVLPNAQKLFTKKEPCC